VISRKFRSIFSGTEYSADVQNERHIALIKIGIACLGTIVTLLWLKEKSYDFRPMLIRATIVFTAWTMVNVMVLLTVRQSQWVPIVAATTMILDILFIASLDLVVLRQSPLNFVSGPLVALYFMIIATASLRHNARLVRLTGILCAVVHISIVGGCYFFLDIPPSFELRNAASLLLTWQIANDVIISLGMALFGYLVGLATRELIESENHYLALFNGIPDGVVIVSSRMCILAINRKFQEMVGIDTVNIVGKPLQHFFAGDASTFSLRLNADRFDESPFSRLYGAEGSLPVHVTQTPIDWNGQKCLELSVRDMSERYELELALARSHKMQTVGKLAGGLAHDFNNILAGIFGGVSLARRSIQRLERSGETRDIRSIATYLDTISDCGQTASHILDRLSTFSRSALVETSAIDLLEILNDTVSIMRNTLPDNIRIHIRDTTPLTVKADRTSLTQALLNLCINARDAIGTNEGTIELSALPVEKDLVPEDLSTDEDQDYICIRVKDDGPGMNPATLQKIFDPFFTTKEKDQGTGIGLSMVYNIAFAHGGTVDVTSDPGKETVFLIYIQASRDSLIPLD
jgi:PAS domain S-box-containing protein